MRVEANPRPVVAWKGHVSKHPIMVNMCLVEEYTEGSMKTGVEIVTQCDRVKCESISAELAALKPQRNTTHFSRVNQ